MDKLNFVTKSYYLLIGVIAGAGVTTVIYMAVINKLVDLTLAK
jgi:hypothetical protein